MTIRRLILASSSPYRLALLGKLGITCDQIAPDVDETPLAGEPPAKMASRLAADKALAVSRRVSGDDPWLILASDQVCHLDGQVYHKPGNHDAATRHLQAFSGRTVTFSTAITLLTHDNRQVSTLENYDIAFRTLDADTIQAYLELDRPYDCAGAIKVEAAGVTLLSGAAGRDINSLYGLPLMGFVDLLEELGLSITNFR